MQYNRELEIINTSNKAYLLGLFYSDGNISNDFICRIQLHIKDKELLEKIVEIFPFFKIHILNEKFTIYKNSKLLYQDLKANGLLERKSFENKENLKFPKIERSLWFDFLRGYIDGNGSININKYGNRTDKKVYIYSINNYLSSQFKLLLKFYNIEFQHKIDERLSKFSSKKCNLNCISIKPSSQKLLYELLYPTNVLCLKRKKDKFNLLYNSKFFIPTICLPCPKCNGKLIKNGIDKYYNKQRYLCKKCNKTILETALSNSNVTLASDELLES